MSAAVAVVKPTRKKHWINRDANADCNAASKVAVVGSNIVISF
jgi:hypothetical protein